MRHHVVRCGLTYGALRCCWPASPMTLAAGVPKHDWSLPIRPGLQIEEDNEYAGAINAAPVLIVDEAERYVESLRQFSLQDIGGSSWFEQYRRLAKLNLQAHQSAMARTDEYVLEALLTFDKVGVLVHELLAIEAWKEAVLPRLMETERVGSGKCAMRLYFVLYHEATLANFLEIVMFHGHVAEQAGDLLVELVDYCSRKMTRLISGRATCEPRRLANESASEAAKDIENRLAELSPVDEVRRYQRETDFRVCVTATALIRFLCEHLPRLPLGVMTRVLDTHDVLLGLVILIEHPPWTRRTDEGKWQKFVDFEWRNVSVTDLLKVTKTEGQIWLAMYHLMCDEECRKRYHFNSMRKANILRVRKYLNDVLLDQLPVLAGVQRYMDMLTIMDVPEPPSMGAAGGLLMEQIPEVRRKLTHGQDWDELALQATSGVFATYDDADDPDVRSVASLFIDGDQEDWGSGSENRSNIPGVPLAAPPPRANPVEGRKESGNGAVAGGAATVPATSAKA